MRVKNAFDRLIKDLPPKGIYLERPTSTRLKILIALPSAEEEKAINAKVDEAHEKALQFYKQQQQLHEQEQEQFLHYNKEQRTRLLKDRLLGWTIIIALVVLIALLTQTWWVVAFPILVLILVVIGGGFSLPEELQKKDYKKLLPQKATYYQRPLSYTHLLLELSPRGGTIHEYKNQKKVGFILEFKWYEIKQVIQRLTVVPYVLLRVNKTSGYPLFSELRSAVKVEYCSQLLSALVQQRHIGQVPEDWYQPAGLEDFEPEIELELPEEKIKIEREEHEPAPMIDLSHHLIDEQLY